MLRLTSGPPISPVEPVTDLIHGVPVIDPYRWLEDQGSLRTRKWIHEQTLHARAHLDDISGRDQIENRIRELLAVETIDSVQKVGGRYFYRKRLPDQEQPCIYMREGLTGEDQLLINPAEYDSGKYRSVRLLRISPDGSLVLYEIKQGGERTGEFELFETETRTRLSDNLPRGLLRGFVFSPDGRGFYYSHEPLATAQPFHRAAYYHILGTPSSEDHEIFYAGEDKRLRLFLLGGDQYVGILIHRCWDKVYTDFHLLALDDNCLPSSVLSGAEYAFEPILTNGRILALTDRDAPNRRIVEVLAGRGRDPDFIVIVPEQDVAIHQWAIVRKSILATYIMDGKTKIHVYDFEGNKKGEIPTRDAESIRFVGPLVGEELIFEAESFTEPINIWRSSTETGEREPWSKPNDPLCSETYGHRRVWYKSKDGTWIPIFLVGRWDVLEHGAHPTIMTSYGGFGVSLTPQFSILVAYLLERGCLFALPCVRGGGEFGADWHNAAKRRNRQTAFDDFLCAAEWLIETGRTAPERFGIFGGSNAGLLVAAALTQRPDLFRAVVCIAPMLDMLRYHLFDESHIWKDEFGTAEDPEDFAALVGYSPYHHVRHGTSYPATMIISGDADSNCNPFHARKMTAQLQAASRSRPPILLDYTEFRGHSPVLPLSERIRGLTDRVAFLCDQLQLPR